MALRNASGRCGQCACVVGWMPSWEDRGAMMGGRLYEGVAMGGEQGDLGQEDRGAEVVRW